MIAQMMAQNGQDASAASMVPAEQETSPLAAQPVQSLAVAEAQPVTEPVGATSDASLDQNPNVAAIV
jgi:hypothetical protein